MIARGAERHAKGQGGERHQDGAVADLIAGQDRSLLVERDAAQEELRHRIGDIIIGRRGGETLDLHVGRVRFENVDPIGERLR